MHLFELLLALRQMTVTHSGSLQSLMLVPISSLKLHVQLPIKDANQLAQLHLLLLQQEVSLQILRVLTQHLSGMKINNTLCEETKDPLRRVFWCMKIPEERGSLRLTMVVVVMVL